MDRRLLYYRMRRRAVVPYATATSGQPLPYLPPPMARTGVPADEGRTALPIFQNGTPRQGVLCGSAPTLYSSRVQQQARIQAHHWVPLRTTRGTLTCPTLRLKRGCQYLGVKGSRVQVPPSRLVRGVFRSQFREPTGEPMAFPERRQAGSVAFAFRVRFTAGAVFGESGQDLLTVDRLGDRRAAVPDQVGNVLQASIVRAEDGHERECRSSRGVHAPPTRAASVILPNSFRTPSGPAAFRPRGRTRDRALATSPPHLPAASRSAAWRM